VLVFASLAVVAGIVPTARADTRPTLAPDESRSIASQAAGWLAATALSPDGAVHDPSGAPDAVSTAWSVLAMRAAGLDPEAENPDRWLEQHVDALARDRGQDSPAGLAMLILVARAENRPADTFGGQDLVARLLATRAADGLYGAAAADQRDSDPLGGIPSRQGLVLSALGSVGRTDADAAEWLEQRQCPTGGWQFDRISPNAPCAPDPVTTGYAVQGLAAVGREVPTSAIDTLARLQQPDGGFPLFPAVTDALATALGLQALIAAGEDPNTDRWRKGSGAAAATPFDALLRFDTDASAGFSTRPDTPPDTRLTSRVVIAAAGQPLPLAPADPTAGADESTGSQDPGTTTAAEESSDSFSAVPLVVVAVGALAGVGALYAYRRRRHAL
jgi:hypothetical protein